MEDSKRELAEPSACNGESASHGLEKTKRHPIEDCSLFSFVTASWMTPLLRLGSKNPLEMSDVYDLPSSMAAATVGAKFVAAFENTSRSPKEGRRITRALYTAFGGYFRRACLFIPLLVGSHTLMPLALKALIGILNNELRYLEDPFLGVKNPWGLAGILCLCAFGITMGMNLIFLTLTLLGCQCRTALMEALYQKVVRLSESSLQQSSLGQIVTLASADLERIFLGALQSILLIISFLLIASCFILFILELGFVPTVGGFAIVVIMLPVNTRITQVMGRRKRAMLELTDARVCFMTDILKGIRIVKLNAWEKSVENHIQGLRIKETTENNVCVQLMLLTQSTGYTIPALIPFFMFMTYLAMGNEMTVERVFAVLALMNVIRFPMQLLPRAINGLKQAQISLRRIEQFLSIPERGIGWQSLKKVEDVTPGSRNDIELQMVSCSWGGAAEREAIKKLAAMGPKDKGKGKGKAKGKGQGEEKNERKGDEAKGEAPTNNGEGEGKDCSIITSSEEIADVQKPLTDGDATLVLSGVTLTVPRGQKVAVIGRVASGKSSLLSSLLGELEVKSGSIARSTPVVPYCCQSAWIQSSTVKQNVLFGLAENVDLYNKSVVAAQLAPDFQILPDGDQTSIGENGINLSGGQKARIALARAFYSALYCQAPLILLDDPIAAVDAFVAHAIFKEGFLGLLKEQTVMLTLNAHLDLLASFDRVIVLGDGALLADGKLADIMAAVPWVKEAVGENQTQDRNVNKAPATIVLTTAKTVMGPVATEADATKQVATRPLYEPEDRVTGRVQLHNYIEWAKCAISDSGGSSTAGCLILIAIVFLFSISQVLRMLLDIWLARWFQDNEDTETGIMVYGILAAGFIASVMLRVSVFTIIAMRSCRSIHRVVLEKVLSAPINLFFDVTPSGRILNRFSGDLEKMDDKVPQQFYSFLNQITTVAGAIAVCLASSPFVICGIPFIGYFFFSIVSFYQKSARELKRLDAMSRSPVLQHFSESIRGLSTIRAYGAVPRFVEKYDDLVSDHAKVFFAFWMGSRWLAVRVDLCAAFFQSFVALVAIAWKDHIDPVMVGIALVWGFQLSGLLQFCVRSFAEVENTMTGIERLVAYKNVPQEAPHVIEPRPVIDWPNGEIELINVSARYRPELPLVLKGVNMHVKPGERVGICGRTGSGKSTMGLILFRMVEAESGQILFNGQDTRTIGLRDLRQRICMIPQDPIIFRMTVRENLDPFNRHDDQKIWKCLELVCMDAAIRALNGDLCFLCAEGGTNFSLGQMQLLCIARALLQKSGLVMMDEATANIDAASDEIIQRTIRSHFVNITVLTIAHRLTTIVDSTKIAVFDQGELIEFGTPPDLVDKGGALAALFKEAGIELSQQKKVLVTI